MCQQHHVVTLAAAGWPAPPGEIAALTNTKHAAQAMDGEFRFRPVDEREPHRLPSRAKKAVAFFRMSRSWRRISFSRRSRFSSAVTSVAAATGFPRITVDWDTSQADDFRTRGVPWMIKRTSLERG